MGKQSRKRRGRREENAVDPYSREALEHVVFFGQDGPYPENEQQSLRALMLGGEYRNVMDRASEDDREWFACHPGSQWYIRPYVPGEFLPVGWYPALRFVMVTQIQPGLRSRRPLPIDDGRVVQYVSASGTPCMVLVRPSDELKGN